MKLLFIRRGKIGKGTKSLDLFEKIHNLLKKDKKFHPQTETLLEVLNFYCAKKGIK